MRYLGSYLAFLMFFLGGELSAGEIALTFDDAPRPAVGHFDGSQRATRLIQGLRRAKVPQVTFFANSVRLDEEGRQRLAAYAGAGHSIGNHTHSHPNFNATEVATYIDDVRQADRLLRPLPGFVAWFRFPFLREGETVDKRDALRVELNRLNYKNAYITVNNYDWHMESLFQEALRKRRKINMQRLGETYVEVLVDSVAYYDQMAQEVLGRSPKHVLLLHENDLAALFIGGLVTALQKAGWKIISPAEAYKDDIANYVHKEPLRFNPGRVGEIAIEKGWSNQQERPKNKLWHPACDEQYLAELFAKNAVFE